MLPGAERAQRRRTRDQPRAYYANVRRYLLLALAAGALVTFLASLYYHPSLPEKEQRDDEDANLHAPPTAEFCKKIRPPLVCAHGGDTTKAFPNTAKAFRAAIDAGADCVEIDVARTKDDELVVMHVRELHQLTGGPPNMQVADYTYEQLKALRWPSGDAILTVEEAVLLTSPFVACITLDVKTYQGADGKPRDEDVLADSLVLLVHETQCENCMVWAKSDAIVRRIKRLSPGQRAGYIVSNETAAFRAAGMHLALRLEAPEVVGAWWGALSPELRDQVHGAGKVLYAWTVNEARMLRHALDVGVDAVVTNYPATAISAIEYRVAMCGGGGTTGGAGGGRDHDGL